MSTLHAHGSRRPLLHWAWSTIGALWGVHFLALAGIIATDASQEAWDRLLGTSLACASVAVCFAAALGASSSRRELVVLARIAIVVLVLLRGLAIATAGVPLGEVQYLVTLAVTAPIAAASLWRGRGASWSGSWCVDSVDGPLTILGISACAALLSFAGPAGSAPRKA